jgi:hypothetical protein
LVVVHEHRGDYGIDGSFHTIADLRETRQHATRRREMGWRNVKRRNLGWRIWYCGPWISTRLVTATKPA